MSEETDAPVEGGSEIVEHDSLTPEAEATETSDDATEQDTGTEETGQADDAGEATEESEGEKAKRVPWFQKRIDEVTAKKYEAERAAEYWRGVAEARAKSEQPQQQEQAPDRWEDPDGYDRWLMGQVTAAAEQRAVEAYNNQRIATAAQQFMAEKPDYQETIQVFGQMANVNPHLVSQMQAASNPAQFAYDTAKQAIAINQAGSLEAYIEQQAATRTSTASQKAPPPPPPKTVSGLSAGIGKSPEDMSMAEYIAWRNSEG